MTNKEKQELIEKERLYEVVDINFGQEADVAAEEIKFINSVDQLDRNGKLLQHKIRQLGEEGQPVPDDIKN